MRRLALLALLLLGIAFAAPLTLPARPGSPSGARRGPGRPEYDVTHVRIFGPRSAKRVLILVPGYISGAGDFSEIAPDILKRVPGLQVWAWDRRPNAFEDTSVFAKGDPDQAYSYYLNGGTVDGRTFKPLDPATVPFVRDWGLKLELEDLRNVVLEGARRRPAPGDPRRAFARRLHHRGVCGLGLQRPPGLQGPVRSGPDRRRPARHLRHTHR